MLVASEMEIHWKAMIWETKICLKLQPGHNFSTPEFQNGTGIGFSLSWNSVLLIIYII